MLLFLNEMMINWSLTYEAGQAKGTHKELHLSVSCETCVNDLPQSGRDVSALSSPAFYTNSLLTSSLFLWTTKINLNLKKVPYTM